MKIIYPPLVEQGLRFYQEQEGIFYEKSSLYRLLVQQEILTENGLPTEKALKQGWIKDYFEEENLSFEAFLAIYPLFSKYEATHFCQIDGFWEMTLTLKEELMQGIRLKQFSYNELIQIEAYLEDRS